MTAAILIVFNLAQLWRETNSHAATAHGITAFAKKQYAAAVAAFDKANAIQPSPQRAFNLGTAQVAAGDREKGSSTLQKAMTDPRLRAAALFNRGNSALESKAFDRAIRDYAEALRMQPGDGAAKRNLEIALIQKNAMQQSSGGSQRSQKGASQPNQSKTPPQPAPNQQQQKNQSADDALLRSVQQQEQQELQRMNKRRAQQTHVGW